MTSAYKILVGKPEKKRSYVLGLEALLGSQKGLLYGVKSLQKTHNEEPMSVYHSRTKQCNPIKFDGCLHQTFSSESHCDVLWSTIACNLG